MIIIIHINEYTRRNRKEGKRKIILKDTVTNRRIY